MLKKDFSSLIQITFEFSTSFSPVRELCLAKIITPRECLITFLCLGMT